MSDFDATVVGAGPNGLAAAVELARSGRRVLVVESSDRIGGGARTEEVTLPGFRHDICSAIHPSGLASAFFAEIGLEVDWVQPPIPFSHPLDGSRAIALHRSVAETAAGLGEDRTRYQRMVAPLADSLSELIEVVFSPFTLNPPHKLRFARLAFLGGLPASFVARRFSTEEGRALFAGMAAHSIAPFSALTTTGVGLMLGLIGHVRGWPLVRRGTEGIIDALASRLVDLGGVIETGRLATSVADLPGKAHLLDVMPPAALTIGGERLSARARRRLSRWKPGPGVFKVDWALDGPVPWADPLSGRAGTVHVGGTLEEIEGAEREVFRGQHPEQPFVLVAQQSLFDPTRAPQGKHTLWAYCHVPNGSTVDMTARIEDQIERFAPGFKELILGRSTRNSIEYQAYNPSIVGGDIGGGQYGIAKVMQIGKRRPYDLGGGVYLCSAATPPGAGVHGMCGHHAAQAVLSTDP